MRQQQQYIQTAQMQSFMQQQQQQGTVPPGQQQPVLIPIPVPPAPNKPPPPVPSTKPGQAKLQNQKLTSKVTMFFKLTISYKNMLKASRVSSPF